MNERRSEKREGLRFRIELARFPESLLQREKDPCLRRDRQEEGMGNRPQRPSVSGNSAEIDGDRDPRERTPIRIR
jgi:hypothetical protein